jgi:hypothetical protein
MLVTARMSISAITPGPLGIRLTRPSADAPAAMARRASAGEAMQQILMRGYMVQVPDGDGVPQSARDNDHRRTSRETRGGALAQGVTVRCVACRTFANSSSP